MLRIGEIATASMPKAQIINLLQVPGGSESQQVMLQVRFAEVNRRKLSDAGLALFVHRQNFAARATTQQYPAPDFDDEKAGGLVFSDYLNLFFFDRSRGFGGVLKALQSSGGFLSLAEPNLIAYNGQEASFLAGGELPIPVVQGTTGSVTVVFKEFGIRLTFRPTIAGDVIRLKVKPEVSSLDLNNGIRSRLPHSALIPGGPKPSGARERKTCDRRLLDKTSQTTLPRSDPEQVRSSGTCSRAAPRAEPDGIMSITRGSCGLGLRQKTAAADHARPVHQEPGAPVKPPGGVLAEPRGVPGRGCPFSGPARKLGTKRRSPWTCCHLVARPNVVRW